MKIQPTRDWDDAFANMAHVPNSNALPNFWAERAAAYRNGDVRIEESAYGDHARERCDIIWPDSTPTGLAVFVHGGYWMRLDKSYWTDLAEGARALGWAVCMPSYTLAPEARISSMTKQVGAAIGIAAEHIDGPIRLAGHSAGGHLVTRMLCQDTPLHADVSARIEHTISISGLHDLRPLLHTKMNDTLKLDIVEATLESATLKLPNGNPSLTAWVGGHERPEFIRQAQIIAQMWEGLDAVTQCVIDGDHNHFTVIEGLKESESAITRAFVG
jgi:arylformamidase